MSKGQEVADYLDDILAAIADVAEFTGGMFYEAFAADKKTANAVIRSLECPRRSRQAYTDTILFRPEAPRHPVEQMGRHAGCAHPRLHGR